MGFLVVRISGHGDGFTPFVIALSDNDTLHEYFTEYLVDGWTQEILHYLPSDIDNWDYAHTLERREAQAHHMKETRNGRDDLSLE